MLDRYASLNANWSYPTAIRFGAGRIAELPAALATAGITRPLFVTDPDTGCTSSDSKIVGVYEDPCP